MSKLRTKYESHEAKRALCAAYDLFLADERIIPVLPKLLGTLQLFLDVSMYHMARLLDITASHSHALTCACMVCVRCRQGLLQEEEAAHPGRSH